MNAFATAATALLLLLIPLGLVTMRRRPLEGLIALQLAGALATLTFICLAEAFHRSTYFGVAVICAVTSWISGLIYARFLGRWL
jgi:multisubunit Na+/H+ antiporter MnhF subunit